MSEPDLIDERFDDLVRELRSAEPTASTELRERVRETASGRARPKPARTRRLPRRRVLVLVPVAAALGVAVGLGALSSGPSPRQQNAFDDLSPQAAQSQFNFAPPNAGQAHDRVIPGKLSPSPSPSQTGTSSAGLPAFSKVPLPNTSTDSPLAPSGTRAQNYSVDLSLRVKGLSPATKRAINLTRGWGGYVVTVDYGSGQKSGTAYLVLRVPIGKVQTAVAKLGTLGTILGDHVSVQDVQGQLDKRYLGIQNLKAKLAKLSAEIIDPSMTTSQRAAFQAVLAQRTAQLVKLQAQQQAQITRTSFATVALALQTKQAAAAVPSKPGRIGQALHNIGHVLVTELEILLYVVLIGAPFIVLALLLWGGHRTWRRRSEDQLLAR
jgi:hypothetical protein